MKRISCSDWLPERSRWSHLDRSGSPAVFLQAKNLLPTLLESLHFTLLYLSVNVFSTTVLIEDTVNSETNIINETETC